MKAASGELPPPLAILMNEASARLPTSSRPPVSCVLVEEGSGSKQMYWDYTVGPVLEKAWRLSDRVEIVLFDNVKKCCCLDFFGD